MSNYKVTGIDQTEDPTIHFALFSDCDPTTLDSAVKEEKWRKAMDDEIDAIERNDTWELNDLLKGHKTIGVKSVFKIKLKENGEVDKYKARLGPRDTSKNMGSIIQKNSAVAPRCQICILACILGGTSIC